MFEITGEEIAALNDVDLRTLIGRLCEAELRRHGFSPGAATYGGNQTAKDGGLDVRVALLAGNHITGFIPRASTGFQVKKPDMPPAAIAKEMRPGGTLRPVIVELAQDAGAYIIVSAAGSTADTALQGRRQAMTDAVKDAKNAASLTIDFYDRNRVATWVRDHAGLIPWVRSRIGKAILGWRSYGPWASRPGDADSTYLTDASTRIRTGNEDDHDGLGAVEGINRLRSVLRKPASVVRLVGLSGVGKTRLVEALFDATVGDDALDPSLAIYADIADGPDPQPARLASDLNSACARAILVIDNCTPAIHRQLSDITRASGSTISVITVEYDIREDQPEGTDVFSLESSSPELITALIKRRFPHVSEVDSKTIAEVSGGNARVALALAATVRQNETIAGLSDAVLFERLFHQRNHPDPMLLAMAQACALVYSFNVEVLEGSDAEISFLGILVGKSTGEMFAAVADLKSRQLVQARGPWRALLPHAIANRLASTALERIPRAQLLNIFVDRAPHRLLQSFSRRLGYLHDSAVAHAIVERWLAPDGLLADITALSDTGKAIFKNVAPVHPEAVLAALEIALACISDEALVSHTHLIETIRALAYDTQLFVRAVKLLERFARRSNDEESNAHGKSRIESLFTIILSGTQAPLALRLDYVNQLLRGGDADRKLGVRLLAAMLKTNAFLPLNRYEFGMRSRDYGYWPRTGDEILVWFTTVLDFAEAFALHEASCCDDVRSAIAISFRGLWAHAKCRDDLERIALSIAAKGFWRDGWIAVRQTRVYERAGLKPDELARLEALERQLRPVDLADKVRGVVLQDTRGRGVQLDDFEEVEDNDFAAAITRVAAVAEQLGRDVAMDESAFADLLPELFSAKGNARNFGCGLAAAADDPSDLWSALVAQFSNTVPGQPHVLIGFLEGLRERDPRLRQELLDEAVTHSGLAESYPLLQAASGVDEQGVARLYRALEINRAPIFMYRNLAFGGACNELSGAALKGLLKKILARPDGTWVALEILTMRIHNDSFEKKPSAPEVGEIGRELLSDYAFRPGNVQREDHDLAMIARASLAENLGENISRNLCQRILAAVETENISLFDYGDLVKALLILHPEAVLDTFAGAEQGRRRGVLADLHYHHINPFAAIPDTVLLAWCAGEPASRYVFAAHVASLFDEDINEGLKEWKPIARSLLLQAPDRVAVFKIIADRLHPNGGAGSISSQHEARLKFLHRFDLHGMPELEPARTGAATELQRHIDFWVRTEADEDRKRSERFE